MTSRRHHRRAALPGAGYTRPSSLDPTGLIVTVFGESSGVEGTFDFTTLPGTIELRRAFAAALDRKSGPGGTWRSGEMQERVLGTARVPGIPSHSRRRALLDGRDQPGNLGCVAIVVAEQPHCPQPAGHAAD
ncbi:MAG: hypothetical protein EOP24_47550, partial [Hyphomicrobiales bacterium]